MADDDEATRSPSTPNLVEEGLKDLNLQKEDLASSRGRMSLRNIKREGTVGSGRSPSSFSGRPSQESPKKPESSGRSSAISTPKNEEVIPGSVVLKQESGQPPKLARVTSQKVASHSPPLFDREDDRTAEAKGTFQVIPGCIYSSKAIGATDHAMDCECTDEWGQSMSCLSLSTAVADILDI